MLVIIDGGGCSSKRSANAMWMAVARHDVKYFTARLKMLLQGQWQSADCGHKTIIITCHESP